MGYKYKYICRNYESDLLAEFEKDIKAQQLVFIMILRKYNDFEGLRDKTESIINILESINGVLRGRDDKKRDTKKRK